MVPLDFNTKKHPTGCFYRYGGEAGIRTLGRLLTYAGFQDALRHNVPTYLVDFYVVVASFYHIKCQIRRLMCPQKCPQTKNVVEKG